MAKRQIEPETKQPENEPQSQPQLQLRLNWILVLLALAGVYYLLTRVQVSLPWDRVMEFLDVQDRERYTKLGIFCVVLTLVVAMTRILRK